MIAVPFAVGQASAGADTRPPTGCFITMTPTFIVTCDGMIVWGRQHGMPQVHSVVAVDAPVVSDGMTVTYAWKVGTVYHYDHHYYGIGWSCVGKNLSVKVLVRTHHGGFSRYYNFGVVKPRA
ncbi:hypothetical protein [Nocardioides baekrokdamisoli]|nr:hypothetical protein [Nocardioides baekrokdamisoli]